MSLSAIADALTVPFRGHALAVNATFGIVVGLSMTWMTQAGVFALFGLPVVVLLVPWFLKYALVVAESAANGEAGPPRMSLDHLNPLEVQPLVLAIGLFALYEGLAWALGPAPALAGIALLAPASLAVLVLQERALDALNPWTLARCVRGLGVGYPLVVGVLGAGVALGALALRSQLAVGLAVPVLQSVLLATLHGFGRVLHARGGVLAREALQPAPEPPRLLAERERRAFEDRLAASFRLAQADRTDEAVDGLVAFARARDERLDVYDALLARALAWPEGRAGAAFARCYIDRLRRRRRHGEALEVFLRAFDRQPAMRPAGEEATLRLARDARDRGRADAALALYGDFERRFPGSPWAPIALVEGAFLLFREQARAQDAAALVDRLAREHPSVLERPDVQRLRARVGVAAASA